jgi:hypothetical protein
VPRLPQQDGLLRGQVLAAGEAPEKQERAEAKGRQGTRMDKHAGKLPEGSAGDTRDKVAEAVGMSGRTDEKAKAPGAVGRGAGGLAEIVARQAAEGTGLRASPAPGPVGLRNRWGCAAHGGKYRPGGGPD